jgi:hypothetical protein
MDVNDVNDITCIMDLAVIICQKNCYLGVCHYAGGCGLFCPTLSFKNIES